MFFTSDQEDPAFLRQHKDKVAFIGEGNKAYAFLNTLKADVLVMTTPGLDVLQIKKTKRIKHYSHIVHSLRSPNYRVFGMDYFDSILINSSVQEDFVRELEEVRKIPPKEIINVGSTYCDYLFEIKERLLKNKSFDFFQNRENKKVVLLSPSWGKEGILNRYGMKLIKPLLDSGFLLIIRPHPQSMIVEHEMISALQAQTENNLQVYWDIGTPNVFAMQESDVMISDFSGIIFDYLCLYEKPVMTVDFSFCHYGYDSSDVRNLWELSILDKIGRRIPADALEIMPNIIFQALEDKKERCEIQKIKKLLWSHPHCSGEMSAIALLQIYERVLEEKLGNNKEVCEKIIKIKKLLEK